MQEKLQDVITTENGICVQINLMFWVQNLSTKDAMVKGNNIIFMKM